MELSHLEERAILAIVVPCYNEGKILDLTIPALLQLMDKLVAEHGCNMKSFIVLVDDGSDDNTWDLIAIAAMRYPERLRGVRLVSNVGHQCALLSGLDYVTGKCDVALTIDADLQDDLEAIPAMVKEYRKGAELVLGVKRSRAADTWFKRKTALGYYKFMGWIGIYLVENHADCRLMSAKVLYNLRQFPESNLFLRGLLPLLHNRVATVSYDIAPRRKGVSKYSLARMLSLAWDGITSFSVIPIRLISIVGAILFLVSLFMTVFVLVGTMTGETPSEWTWVMLTAYLLGGLIMLSIGMVGEYVGKLLSEVKGRPRFLIDMIVGEGSTDGKNGEPGGG